MQDKLDLYTDYLLSSFGQTSAMGLSRLLDGELSHDSIYITTPSFYKKKEHYI